MNVIAVKTRKVTPPSDDIEALLIKYLPVLQERSIVCVSSKIVSICEGRCVPLADASLDQLVSQESERQLVVNGEVVLTQKDDLLIEWAGIDRSNGNGFYILLPEDPYLTAKKIWSIIRKQQKLKQLGVIITDSHSVPERRGAIGLAIASYGFKPVREYGFKDVFGRPTPAKKASDLADAFAAAADEVMGDGPESTPLAIISDVPNVKFYKTAVSALKAKSYLYVSPEYDVYAPLLSGKNWKKRY